MTSAYVIISFSRNCIVAGRRRMNLKFVHLSTRCVARFPRSAPYIHLSTRSFTALQPVGSILTLGPTSHGLPTGCQHMGLCRRPRRYFSCLWQCSRGGHGHLQQDHAAAVQRSQKCVMPSMRHATHSERNVRHIRLRSRPCAR